MTDEDAIRTLIADWHRFSAAGDLQNVLRLMSDDVVFLTAGREPMIGRRTFEQLSAGMQGQVRFESSCEIEEVRVVGSLAYTRTFLKVTTFPSSGAAPTRRSGRTLSILEKQPDGSWLMTRDANLLTVD